jgi:hypothetical protein
MKRFYLIPLILFFFLPVLNASDFYVTIKISGKEQIKLVKPFITAFDDVKEIRDGKYIYNEENDHITVICNASQLGNLRNTNFEILSVVQYSPPVLNRTPLENTIPYQFGWPRQSSINWPFYYSSGTVADMNHDGELELSVTHSFTSSGTPLLYVYRPNGAFVPGFPYMIPFGSLQNSGSREISAMGDVDGDGQLEIVHADENGNIYCHKFNGTMLPGFPYNTGGTNEHSIPALIDLNGNGKAEIIITSRDRNNDLNAMLLVLTYTGSSVANFPGFPVNYIIGSTSSPVVADIDNDGIKEILVGTGYSSANSYDARILCYQQDGSIKPGWPVIVGPYSVGNSVSLYDINGNGKLEIIIRVKTDLVAGSINGIYAFDAAGSILSPFPFEMPSGHPDANVAIADMDGDGQVEFGYGIVQAVGLGAVYVFKMNGQLLPGYPNQVFATWVDGAVAMADVSGNGLPDVIAPSSQGQVFAFNAIGDSVAGFPVKSEATSLNAFNSSPTMVDLDGDGDVELIAPCNDRKIYVWDTPGIYDSLKTWSTYKGNSARTGTQFADKLVGISSNNQNIPDRFYLEQNYPNPFNPSTVINYSLSENSNVTLKVFDITGKEIATIVNGFQNAGHHSVTFDAVNLSSGIYFYKLTGNGFTDVKSMMVLR